MAYTDRLLFHLKWSELKMIVSSSIFSLNCYRKQKSQTLEPILAGDMSVISILVGHKIVFSQIFENHCSDKRLTNYQADSNLSASCS